MEREYVIIKHPLRVKGNIFLLGTKFCNGIAVVVKNSKAYRNLLKCPLLKNHKELNIDMLPKFGFRSKDIKQVFGKEVAIVYQTMIQKSQETAQEEIKTMPIELEAVTKTASIEETKIEEVTEAHKEIKLCAALKASKEVCKNRVSKKSTSDLYCSAHCSQE